MGRGLRPFGGVGAESPSNTMCDVARTEAYLHAKFHLDPSNRLATVHQRLTQTERQTGQRSDSTGRVVLQTVAQKRFTLCYQTVVCLSVLLFVTLVHCGQTAGRIIKMKLGM